MDHWARYLARRYDVSDVLWDSEPLPEYLATLHDRKTWPSALNDGPNALLYAAIDEFSRFQPDHGVVERTNGKFTFGSAELSDDMKARAIVTTFIHNVDGLFDEHRNMHMATAVYAVLQESPETQACLRSAAPMSALVFLMGRGV